jgi:uncharacterized protein
MTADASKPRIILDTNTLISGVLFKGEVPREAVRLAFDYYQPVFSTPTWDELTDVFQRDKFDRALPRGQRFRVIAEIARRIEIVEPTTAVHDCRDPRDNKFLSLALDSQSTLIVTGDQDLLALHPWRDVCIVTPDNFVRNFTIAIEELRDR